MFDKLTNAKRKANMEDPNLGFHPAKPIIVLTNEDGFTTGHFMCTPDGLIRID